MSDVQYLTQEGFVRLQKELEELKGPVRQQLSARLRSAIQMGDLSENADYIQAKEEQGFVEGRILELSNILRACVIIDESDRKRDLVDIGSHITIQEVGFPDEETYHLVGPKEADPKKGRISYESPIGKSLLGKHAGAIVNVETPGGVIQMKIIKIE